MDSAGHDHEHRDTAWDSLWKVARLEGGDIWTVLIFAVGVTAMALLAPLGVEQTINAVQFGGVLQPLLVMSLLLLAAFVFGAGFLALQFHVVEAMQQRLFARVALRVGRRLPLAPERQDEYLPEVVNRFLEIATAQKAFAVLLIDGLALVLNTLAGMAILGFYHPFLLGFDVALVAALSFVIFALGRGAMATAVAESNAKYDVMAWLQDMARSHAAFRPAPAFAAAMQRLDGLVSAYLRQRQMHYRIWRKQLWFALALQAAASAGLLALGGWLVANGGLTVGQLVAAYLIVSVVVGSFVKFAKHLQKVYDLGAAAHKLQHLMEMPQAALGGERAAPTGPWSVRLRRLQVRMHAGHLVGPLDLDAPAGSRVALFGAAGSGSSELLETLYGLKLPAAGRFEYADVDWRELDRQATQARIGWAGRPEPVHGPVLENVMLDRRDVSAEAATEALEAVGLLEPCRELADGLDTVLAPDGRPLNFTQTAKLQLARAIAPRPALLLIDGLLDALPPDVRVTIAERLLSPQRPWTAIVRTSLPEIAALCDREWSLIESEAGVVSEARA